MAVTYEERKALLTDLVLRMRQQRTPEGSVTPIYQIVDAPPVDPSHEYYPYVEAVGSTVRIRVHPLLAGYRDRWDTPGQRADGFDAQSDRSFGNGPRRLNRVVKEKTKDIPKLIHGSVVTHLTSVREHNRRKDQQRAAERDSRRVAKERVEALAATLAEEGFDVRALFEDTKPCLVIYFMKDVHLMLEPQGTRFGLGFVGKTRTLEAPESPANAAAYMRLVRDFFLGIAALKGK